MRFNLTKSTKSPAARQSAPEGDFRLHTVCTRGDLTCCNQTRTSPFHHRRSRKARCLGGCVQGHSAISLGPPSLGTVLLCTPYAHERRAATLPRRTTGIRRLLGGSGSYFTYDNRTNRVSNLGDHRRRRSRERTLMNLAANAGNEPNL